MSVTVPAGSATSVGLGRSVALPSPISLLVPRPQQYARDLYMPHVVSSPAAIRVQPSAAAASDESPEAEPPSDVARASKSSRPQPAKVASKTNPRTEITIRGL